MIVAGKLFVLALLAMRLTMISALYFSALTNKPVPPTDSHLKRLGWALATLPLSLLLWLAWRGIE